MATRSLAPAFAPAPICSPLRIKRDCLLARAEFRARRLLAPLAEYNAVFPVALAAAIHVVDSLDRILMDPSIAAGQPVHPVDRTLLADIVFSKAQFQALRALAAPPISEDDLDTLLQASLSRKALRTSQELANEVGQLFYAALDPQRFPWVRTGKLATGAQLRFAKQATAVMTSMNTVQTQRRSDERAQLEGAVADLLLTRGYVRAPRPANGIPNVANLPSPGTFVQTTKLGRHNADLVIRLKDGRLMAMECKASNSTVNGEKRLNKEVAADVGDWKRQFGTTTIVAAALRGVYKAPKVQEAQDQEVCLFWWHRLRGLAKFLDAAV